MNEGFDDTMKSRARITPEAQDTFVPGQLIGGRFKVISRLGSGGMGTVYRVEQIFLKSEFALKTMDNRTGSDVMIHRFQLEAKAASSLNHPNLVKVHDYGILDNGNPYLVMDFINGITFAEYLKEHGPLPIESVAPLFAQACFGLMAAHEQSVVHRDLKPANLMLLNNVDLDTEGSVKLVDFGLAKLVNRQDGEIQALTRTGEIFGSPLYMSPEQCSSGTVDHRSDIYSLGCVLFEMLTGTPPHMGQNALKTMLLHQSGDIPTLKEASLGRDFPEALERIVAKMLQKHPEQRYQNIGLVAHDLTRLGSENRPTSKGKERRSINKPPATAPKVVSMSPTQFYTLLALVGIFAAVFAGLGVYFINHEQTKTASASQTNAKTQASDKQEQSTATNDLNSPAQVFPERVCSDSDKKKEILENIGPIKETTVIRNNEKQHMYVFPNISLGSICSYTFQNFGQPFCEAQGTVYVPADKPIAMKIGNMGAIPMLEAPSIFKKIPGQDFQGLIFSVPTDGISDLAIQDGQSPATMEKNVATSLQNLAGWTNLKSIHLKTCSLNEAALTALNNFKKLRLLTIDQCMLNPENIANQPFLSRLTHFYIRICKFANGPVISRLCHSEALQALVVDEAISVENLHNLQRCPNLEFLQITCKQFDDKAVQEICGLHNLQTISLLDATLTDKQIKTLSHCSRLQHILLSKSAYGNDSERVKAMDPRIYFAEGK